MQLFRKSVICEHTIVPVKSSMNAGVHTLVEIINVLIVLTCGNHIDLQCST